MDGLRKARAARVSSAYARERRRAARDSMHPLTTGKPAREWDASPPYPHASPPGVTCYPPRASAPVLPPQYKYSPEALAADAAAVAAARAAAAAALQERLDAVLDEVLEANPDMPLKARCELRDSIAQVLAAEAGADAADIDDADAAHAADARDGEQEATIPPRETGSHWCTSTARRRESLLYPAHPQPFDDPDALAAAGPPEASPRLTAAFKAQLEGHLSQEAYNAILHGAREPDAGRASSAEIMAGDAVSSAPDATTESDAIVGARVFSRTEARAMGHAAADDDDAAAELGLRSILWRDEVETDHGSIEHFERRRERLARPMHPGELQLEAYDIFLEQLRRREREIVKRKRIQELENLRGPRPGWYALRDASFNDELCRHNALLRSSSAEWASRMSYSNELLSAPLG
ncbi:uncharacterized protein AMSG_06343 [Thecamonas trahens ATCC 50062]|uniref:Uncharacterized protein n=1 Tax=Thecamonas trahens ATCC 50062 TaxID=461836 RepID=A0A0L0DFU6_THETB|nr:hypothetical protein AMSG_06343 [Thecamonas trahens ATCC 50062]KNC50198.1 hypothetical protein AMSG_06343 [Thecamonas trahens ATCC 50062]|eukprot:XP_013757035.1 hypothetical protein AMSG_06343 [Thecamonas trahens ATCC 50062]